MADGPYSCLHTWRYADLHRMILRCTHCAEEKSAIDLACKHNWHFTSEDTLRCQRCGQETGDHGSRTEGQTMPLFDDWDTDLGEQR